MFIKYMVWRIKTQRLVPFLQCENKRNAERDKNERALTK